MTCNNVNNSKNNAALPYAKNKNSNFLTASLNECVIKRTLSTNIVMIQNAKCRMINNNLERIGAYWNVLERIGAYDQTLLYSNSIVIIQELKIE